MLTAEEAVELAFESKRKSNKEVGKALDRIEREITRAANGFKFVAQGSIRSDVHAVEDVFFMVGYLRRRGFGADISSDEHKLAFKISWGR